MQKKSHTVQRLDIHLPGQYRMVNIEPVSYTHLDVYKRQTYFPVNVNHA